MIFPLLRRPRFTLLSNLICEDLCCEYSPFDCPGLTVLKMAPKDSRDSAETNGNVHPGGKGKAKAKISRTSSNTSLRDLTPEALVEGVYGLCLRQKERINELDTTVSELIFRNDQEMTKLQDENNAYQADARQFEREREELKREQATMDDTLKAMQSEVEK